MNYPATFQCKAIKKLMQVTAIFENACKTWVFAEPVIYVCIKDRQYPLVCNTHNLCC